MTSAGRALAACLIASSAITTLQTAQARDGGLAAGLIGGLAAGAIIGSAAAARPAPVYVAPPPAPVYAEPVYEAPPRCYFTRGEPVWDGYGWVRPRMRVCD